MSDFLSRVAARAVGQTAAAQPRLPALFEGPAAAQVSLEIVGEETVAGAPGAELGGTRAAGTVRVVERQAGLTGEPPAAANARPAATGRRTTEARSGARPRDEEPLSAAHTLPGAALADGGAAVGTPAPGAAVTTPPARTAAELPVASATPPVAQATPAASQPLAPEPAVRPSEPPAVRVHIGRLEVRANLTEAPKPRTDRDRPQPQELPLGDYLRGKRSTG